MWAAAGNNAANDYGITPLWLAATNGNAPITELLLEAGANPNLGLSTGATPIMGAARTGHVAVARALLAHGANANAHDTRRGQTALMWAAAEQHADLVQLLIQAGADIRARSQDGFTPLLFAARSGDLESAGYLLAAGVQVDEASPDGRTALLTVSTSVVATSTGQFMVSNASDHERLALLLMDRGADPKRADSFGITPLHGAVRTGKRELVAALLAKGADPNARIVKRPPSVLFTDLPERAWDSGATPFLMAAKAADAELMRVLVTAGADPRLPTNNKTTALMATAGVGRSEGASAISEKRAFEAVRAALEFGSDVNAANDAGTTALHAAAMQGADSIVEVLAAHGAELDAKDRRGRTPLSMAEGAKTDSNTILIYRPSTVALLRKLGARTGLKETEGIMPNTERRAP